MALYQTAFPVTKKTKLTTTVKATVPTALDLVVTLADGSTQTIKGDKEVATDWTTITYSLKDIKGEVTAIGYDITTKETSDVYELNLGQLTIGDQKAEKFAAEALTVEDVLFDEEEGNYAGVRLTWEAAKDKTAAVYEVYQLNDDGSRSFLAATPATNHYLNAVERPKGTKTKFAVVAVDRYGNRGKLSDTVEITWPNNQLPKAAFTASKTLAAPGKRSPSRIPHLRMPKHLNGRLKAAISPAVQKKIPATYSEPGTYKVTLVAKNEAGETLWKWRD